MTTTVAPDLKPDQSEREEQPTGGRDLAAETRHTLDAHSLEPRQSRKIDSHHYADPTQGRKIGADPYDDATQGRKIGSDPYDDATRGR